MLYYVAVVALIHGRGYYRVEPRLAEGLGKLSREGGFGASS